MTVLTWTLPQTAVLDVTSTYGQGYRDGVSGSDRGNSTVIV